ncbi:uncharacterized protein LOC106660322 [Trichogramma pretiosum]|uniref:uncharacterized protein LOC106660322 n=1 Tax=Trichogramma pretiosum TaxID=7493 RepID=UPI0006C95A34|nr:uncharacterized protein LOC106660322 [Trichogramma pretiosum]
MKMEDPELAEDSSGCTYCTLDPPPEFRIPPPPLPGFLKHAQDYYEAAHHRHSVEHGPSSDGPDAGRSAVGDARAHEHLDDSPCKHTCDWRGQGVRYVEVSQPGNIFDDTWFIVLVCSCVGVIFIGIILATVLIKCKLHSEAIPSNDNASQCSNRSNKNSTLSTSTASSSMHTTTTTTGGGGGPASSCAALSCKSPIVRLQQEAAILFPCSPQHHLHFHPQQQQQQQQQPNINLHHHHHHHQAHQIGQQPQQDPNLLHDPRVMWATLTPRGTTRHYLEEHTYETIGGGSDSGQPPGYTERDGDEPVVVYAESPCENTYTEPPVASPGQVPKDDKAFDNTGFVDYEDPRQIKNEYYQLEDVLEPCEPIFSVQAVYGMPSRNLGQVANTLRPRVSSPTRIEHPNLPPLNLHRTHSNRRSNKHHQQQQQQQQHQHQSLHRKRNHHHQLQQQQHTLIRNMAANPPPNPPAPAESSVYLPTI